MNIELDEYELVNMLSLFQAVSLFGSPLAVCHTGDWTSQVFHKLCVLAEEAKPTMRPNVRPDDLRQAANKWHITHPSAEEP